MPGNRLKYFIIFAVLFFSCRSDAQKSIFALSDIYSVRPDGSFQEIKNGSSAFLQNKNSHWNASEKTVFMHSAQNEEVAVQIVLPNLGSEYKLILDQFSGPVIIETDRISMYKIDWVNHSDFGFCPDLLIPVPIEHNTASVQPSPIVPNASVIPVFFEVWVPKSATAGLYSSTLQISNQEGFYQKLNIQLEVLDFQIPDQPSFAFEILSYNLPHEDLGFQQRLNTRDGYGYTAVKLTENAKQATYQVYKLAQDNRCYVNSLLYSSQRGYGRYAPSVIRQNDKIPVIDFAAWDDLFSPVLSGATNKYNQPPPFFMLPLNINYPFTNQSAPEEQFDFRPFENNLPLQAGLNPRLAEFEQSYLSAARQFAEHLNQKYTTATLFQVYFNQKPNSKRNRTPWKLDEPVTESDYKALRYFFSLTRQAVGDKFSNRLDIGHFNCDRFQTPDGSPTKCYKAKEFNSKHADAILKQVTDHWVIGVSHAEAAVHTLPEYRDETNKIFVYSTSGAGNAIAGHYGFFAGEGFKSFKMGIDGRVIFKLAIDAGNPAKFEGTDCVIYDGNKINIPAALPSRRLKMWRNSVNEYEYLLMAAKKNPDLTEQILNKMVSTGYSPDEKYRNRSRARAFRYNNNVEDVLKARMLLAAIITGSRNNLPELQGPSHLFRSTEFSDAIINYD